MTEAIVHHPDVVPQELEGFQKKSASLAFAAFARWLSVERTPGELREAREIVQAWNKVIEDFNNNVRSRLVKIIKEQGVAVTPKTLRLETETGSVDLRRNRAKHMDAGLARAQAERRGFDFEKDLSRQVITYEPDEAKFKANGFTEAEIDECKPWVGESVVLS